MISFPRTSTSAVTQSSPKTEARLTDTMSKDQLIIHDNICTWRADI